MIAAGCRPDRLAPLESWYVTHRIPDTGPTQANRRGPKKRQLQRGATE
jgi:hypothetical protein